MESITFDIERIEPEKQKVEMKKYKDCKFNEVCELLQMISVPYLGIYLEEYIFLNPLNVLKQKTMPNNLPLHLKEKIEKFQSEYYVTPEYFHVTLDGSEVYSLYNQRIIHTDYVRINIAPHPYVFYNVNLNKEHRSVVFLSAFTDERSFNSVKDSEEGSGVRVNPDCKLDNNGLLREIILHEGGGGIPAISPNNCAILLNINNQIVNFFLVTLVTYGNKIVKCSVTEYNVLPTAYQSQLLSELTNSFWIAKANEESVKTIYFTYLTYVDTLNCLCFYFFNQAINAESVEKFKDIIIKMFSILFNSIDKKRKEEDKAHYETEIINVSNFYYNSFVKFIHYLYKDEHMKVKNFGNDLIEGYIKTKDNYLLTLLLQYKNFHIKQIQQIFSSYLIYFGITKIDVLKRSYYQEYLSSRWPIKKEQFCAFAGIKIEDLDKIIAETIGRKKITNKNIGIFLQMSNEVLNDNRDAFLKLLDSIDKPLQNLLFFSVWRFKGKIMGVHNDFGRLSFIQSNQICPVYHCSKEEQYEICLQMMSLLETIDNEYNEEKEN